MIRSSVVCVLLMVCSVVAGCQRAHTGGVVAADHPLASKAGAEILAAGGNAVDAAVATSLALSVVRPDSCGLGGGGFMVIHLEDDPRHGTINVAVNYRETCPAGIGPDTYAHWADPEASRFGGRAVGVPGTVAGLLYALEHFGTLDRDVVFAPAIRLAEEGFVVDHHHAEAAAAVRERFEANPAWKARFPWVWERLLAGGAIAEGDTLQLPEQARVLRHIATHGRAGFYEGEVADAIVHAIRADGGVLSAEDLRGYEPVRVEPLRLPWRGRTLVVMPPPSSGGIAIAQLFALVDRLGVDLPASGWPDVDDTHLLAEAMKHAFADRARYLADPAFVDVPIEAMLSDGALDAMAARVDRARTHAPSFYGSAGPLPTDGGTSHLSVVDAAGNAVACTETINLHFGSLLAVDAYGFCLNNEMDDFTTIRGAANAFGLRQSDDNLPEPGKRPLSSMSPTIVLDADGRVLAVAGASGGPRIITGTAQALLRVLLADASAAEAAGSPRIHHQWLPNTLRLEPDAPAWLRGGLSDKGHGVGTIPAVGAVQIIRRTGRGWDAASDPRKGGVPASVEPGAVQSR